MIRTFARTFARLLIVVVVATPLLADARSYTTYDYQDYRMHDTSDRWVEENTIRPVTSARLEDLFRQLSAVQRELTAVHGTQTGCYTLHNVHYCPNTAIRNTVTTTDSTVRAVIVDYRNSAAYVDVLYRDGRHRTYVLGGTRSNEEVLHSVADLTGATLSQIRSVTSFTESRGRYRSVSRTSVYRNTDIDRIDVTIDRDDNDATARVRYENGRTERFTYNTENRDTIERRLADDLDISVSDVEDIIEYDYTDSDNSRDNDIDSIEATIDEDDNETRVRVEFDSNAISTYTYATDSKSRIASHLADDLNISERDVEDIIEYDYR